MRIQTTRPVYIIEAVHLGATEAVIAAADDLEAMLELHVPDALVTRDLVGSAHD